MSDYTTVFQIGRNSDGLIRETLFRLAVGIVPLVAGLIGIYRRIKSSQLKLLFEPLLLCTWSAFWLYLHYPLLAISFWGRSSLIHIEQNGGADIAEGPVTVEHEQPRSGHTHGDVVTIGGKQLEVDHFRVTPGYSQTIAYGGALKPGVYAKVHYHDGVILKVEIRE